MTKPSLQAAVRPLRQRLIDDMTVRRFSAATQRNYIRDVGHFATFLGRPPDTATATDVRQFQVEQQDAGAPVPTKNRIVSALRFFFTHTVDRPDLARKLVRFSHPRTLPVVLSPTRSRACSMPPPASSTRPHSRSPMAPACASPKSPR